MGLVTHMRIHSCVRVCVDIVFFSSTVLPTSKPTRVHISVWIALPPIPRNVQFSLILLMRPIHHPPRKLCVVTLVNTQSFVAVLLSLCQLYQMHLSSTTTMIVVLKVFTQTFRTIFLQ